MDAGGRATPGAVAEDAGRDDVQDVRYVTRHILVARPSGSLWLCKSAILPICRELKTGCRPGQANSSNVSAVTCFV